MSRLLQSIPNPVFQDFLVNPDKPYKLAPEQHNLYSPKGWLWALLVFHRKCTYQWLQGKDPFLGKKNMWKLKQEENNDIFQMSVYFLSSHQLTWGYEEDSSDSALFDRYSPHPLYHESSLIDFRGQDLTSLPTSCFYLH